MEKIGNYGVYQNSVYGQNKTTANKAGAGGAKSAAGTAAAKNSGTVELSSGAKQLLKELQKTYGNTDFMVADYADEEEAAAYLGRGTGEYSVLLTPDELEKMAADEDYKQKNLQTLDDSLAQLKDMKSRLGEKGEDVRRVGIAIGDDGKVSYFAELEKTNEKQMERIEKQRADKKQEAADARREEQAQRLDGSFVREGTKRTTVFAGSVKELQDKIGQVDWNAVREGEYGAVGGRFDFTV